MPKPARLLVTLVIVGVVVGVFAYVGGWLTPEALTPSKIINRFEQLGGKQSGFRRNHAKGVGVSGYFESNGNGVALSKASVFAAGRVPVIGRFALGGGQPYAVDDPHTVRSMAILFELKNGEEWRTGMNNIPVFPVSTPQAFHELLQASAPDPATGKPDPEKMGAFIKRYPSSGPAFQRIGSEPSSSGFENSTYNGLDAFLFTAADGRVTPVRWSMVPVQPFEPLSTAPGKAAANYLFDALTQAIHRHPLQWRLVITVGQPGDSTSDATIPWPHDRQKIDAGTLTIDHVESEATSPARDINFDPLILPDGISGSDDPLLSARSAAYAHSFTRREGEPKKQSAVTAAEVAQ